MRTTLILAIALLLTGCSGTPVQTRYYLLRSDIEQHSRDLAPSKNFAMGMIVIAPYIEQPGIILETAAGEIRPAMQNQWAEPMHEGLQQFLRIEVSSALGEDIFPEEYSEGGLAFDIRIDQFHGTADGDALLVAYWWIRDGGGEILSSHQFAETRALTRDGYGPLVDAEKSLLAELARQIADSLKNPLAVSGCPLAAPGKPRRNSGPNPAGDNSRQTRFATRPAGLFPRKTGEPCRLPSVSMCLETSQYALMPGSGSCLA